VSNLKEPKLIEVDTPQAQQPVNFFMKRPNPKMCLTNVKLMAKISKLQKKWQPEPENKNCRQNCS
jgi:hypothetical protein